MMENKEEPLARKIASYLFIVAVYSILLSVFTYSLQWANRTWWNFNYGEWSFVDWWLFFSIFAFIGTLFFFLSPYIVKQLSVYLDYLVNKMVAKTKVYEKKLESKIDNNKYVIKQEE